MGVDIIYETHSTTTDNEAGIATGWLPGQLSARGQRQARELGARRRDAGIDVVYVSDLRRAVQTATLAFPGREPPVRQDARLRECDYGELNGQPLASIASQRLHHVDVPFPGGQSYRQVLTATDDFLQDLAQECDGQRVLLIAHRANRWALDCLLNGARLEDVVVGSSPWQPGWHYRLST